MSKAVGYLHDAGVEGTDVPSMGFRPDSLWRIKTQDGVEMALKLGSGALEQAGDADVLSLAGGSWLSVAAVPILEAEFGIPVITNLNATYWRFMRTWVPRHPTMTSVSCSNCNNSYHTRMRTT
jgi:maleate cis-trans isomerase